MDIMNCDVEAELENDFLETLKEALLYTISNKKAYPLQNILYYLHKKGQTEKIEFAKIFCTAMTASRMEYNIYYGESAITFKGNLLVRLHEKKLNRGQLDVMLQRIYHFDHSCELPQASDVCDKHENVDDIRIINCVQFLYNKIYGKTVKTEEGEVDSGKLVRTFSLFFDDEMREKICAICK